MRFATQPIETRNFHHLVMDIFWFGLAMPATTRFLTVYAIRVGATPQEIGWLAAMPALALLVATSLSNWWERHFSTIDRAVYWSGLWFRLAFLLPAFTPMIPAQWQPLWLIVAVTLPAIPQGIASVIFVVLMRGAVRDDQLNPLVSRRAFAMNIAVAVSTLFMGLWLTRVSYPLNYQLMFVFAFALTMVSLWHVRHTHAVDIVKRPTSMPHEQPWHDAGCRDVAWLALILHLAVFVAAPLIPLYLIDVRGADEQFIAVFVCCELVGSAVMALYAPRLIERYGSRRLIGPSLLVLGIGVLMMTMAPSLWLVLVPGVLNGAVWTFATLALFAYFTEITPPEKMTGYTMFYNQVIFLAIFVGPLVGSYLAATNLEAVFFSGALVRVGAGLFLSAGLLRIPVVARARRRRLRPV